jgi:hypothetical protein
LTDVSVFTAMMTESLRPSETSVNFCILEDSRST